VRLIQIAGCLRRPIQRGVMKRRPPPIGPSRHVGGHAVGVQLRIQRATCGGDTPRSPALRRVQTAAPRSAHGGRTPPSPLGMRAPPRPPPRDTPQGCATPAQRLSRTARSRSSAPRTSDPALRPASPAPAVHPPTADPAQQSAPPAGPPRRGPRARGSRRRHRSTGPALPPARRSSHPGPWRSAAGSSAPGPPPASQSTTPRHHALWTASRRESLVSTAGDTGVLRASRCQRGSTTNCLRAIVGGMRSEDRPETATASTAERGRTRGVPAGRQPTRVRSSCGHHARPAAKSLSATRILCASPSEARDAGSVSGDDGSWGRESSAARESQRANRAWRWRAREGRPKRRRPARALVG
jgi:hypothetical protein